MNHNQLGVEPIMAMVVISTSSVKMTSGGERILGSFPIL